MQIQDIDPGKSVYSFIEEARELHKARVAIIYYGTRISFGKYFDHIRRFASGLRKAGVKKGDTVTLCLPNIPQNCIAFYAVALIGGVSNIIHPLMPVEEIKGSMKRAGSKVLIASDSVLVKGEIREAEVIWCSVSDYMDPAHKVAYAFITRKNKFRPLKNYRHFNEILRTGSRDIKAEELTGEECAVIMHSGGTTGTPRLVLHSHKALNSMMKKKECFLKGIDLAGKSAYTVLPSFHGFGLCMNTHISSTYAVRQIMAVKFNPKEAVRWIKKYRIQFINGVPAIFNALIKLKKFNKKTAGSIDRCYVGGDNVPDELIKRFNFAVTGDENKMKLFEGYGLTEMIAVCMLNTPEEYKLHTVGKAIPGCRCEIIKDGRVLPRGEEGEVYVGGDVMMIGYFEGKGKSSLPLVEADGEKWLNTGDWGYVDEEGYLHFKQRVKHVIIRKGVNVFPSEIEEIINRLDYVKQCCVVGKQRGDDGSQTVYAYVCLMDRNLRTEKTAEAIKQYVSRYAVKAAVPEKIVFTAKFPRTIIGKIDVKYFEDRPE